MIAHESTQSDVQTLSALDVARAIKARGYPPLPVVYKGKNPKPTGWTTLVIADSDLPIYFPDGQPLNVGGLLGELAGGLIDVDLDAREAWGIAAQFLPPTTAVYGRRSSPRSHYEYRIQDGPIPRIVEYLDPLLAKEDERKKIVEIRGTAHHSVMPGSTHSSGEVIRWDQDGDPGAVDAQDLEHRAATLAAAALLARYWPTGGRHDTALALAGALLRHGWETDRAAQFIGAVAVAAGDPEERDRRATVPDTAARIAANENTVGIPRLKQLLDERVVDCVFRWLHLGRDGAARPAGRYHLTDLGNSERLVARHGERLRYCYAWSKWLVYEGGYWRDDLPNMVVTLAKETVRAIYHEAAEEEDDKARQALVAWAKASESHSRLTAMVALTQSALPINHGDLDPDPWLLNCTNGTIDLRTGSRREHRAGDWITKQAPVAYDPAARCPTWHAFLTSVLGGNQDMAAFLQRVAGYSATGSVREQCLFFLHGSGSNGKSTLLRTLQTVLGAYAMQAKSELLLAKKDADHPTEVADLFNKRLVVTIEVEDGRRFAEALLKQLTGGDRIRARRMREDHWEFDPTHKILLAANHRPVIRGTDHAVWRRIHLIPFEVTIPDAKQDKDLANKLRQELPGILSWLVAGCLDWQRGGLRVPDAVRNATEDYRSQMDVVAQHLADCCECGPRFVEKAGDLYRSYGAYCEANGERTVLSQRRYGESLTERGFAPDRGSGNVHIRRGLRLRPQPSDDGGLFEEEEEVGVPPITSDPSPNSDPLSDPLSDPFTGKSDPCDPKSGIDRHLFLHEGVIPDLGSQGSLRSLSAVDDEFGLVETGAPLPESILTCLYCGTPTAPTTAAAPEPVGASPVVATITCGPSYPELPVRTLSSVDDVQRALPALLAAPMVGFDTETTGLDPLTDRLRLVQLATHDEAYVLDARRVDPRVLAPLFDAPAGAGPLMIAQNAAFDLRFLHQVGLTTPAAGRLFDTELAARLLSASAFKKGYAPVKHGLAAIAQRVLGLSLDKTAQTSDWAGALTEEQLRYAALDAVVLPLIAERLQADLAEAGLTRVAALEMEALPAVAWLMETGAPFDSDGWQRLALLAEQDVARVEQDLTLLAATGGLFANGQSTVKWSSTQQVAALLRERGHGTVTSTEEAVLRQLGDVGEPLAPLLLRHREASKRASTYGLDYLKHVHPLTGRIHASFRQLGSEAGRMSATDPNVQQVPRDKAYRACVRPAPGRVLVKADYAQIELRLAAQIAPDERLVEAFQRGDDLHTVTARTVLGKTDVTKADRQAAKAVNFGLLYGMGAKGLRQYAAEEYGVHWTEQEAQTVRGRFFAEYRGLQAWHRSQIDGEVETRTIAGRRRLGVERYTEKLNTPVQGSGADGLKAALGRLWETRHRVPGVAPILVVHDEIVVECDRGQADEARDWVVDAMRTGMETVLHRVPAEVEATICADWSGAELHISNGTAPREGV